MEVKHIAFLFIVGVVIALSMLATKTYDKSREWKE